MVDVTTIQAGTVFAWFMLVMVLRRFVLIGILSLIRLTRPYQPGWRAPEDDFFKNGPVVASTVSAAPLQFDTDKRINREIANDAENDTYFLILLLATAVYSDSQNGNVNRTIIYGSIYAFLRIFHAVFYILALQPFRTLIFVLGFCCTVACNLDLVITMSRRSN